MSWLKRNLFFVIGIVVAVALLGAAVFYVWSSRNRNNQAYDRLNEIYGKLNEIKPGTDNQANVDAARKQAEEVHQWISSTKDYFQPIASIPATDQNLTDDAFATALHRTITQLQQEAGAANVMLPPAYNFSFQAQSDKVRFAPPGSVQKLAVQLGEVKTIAEIFFAARVNALDGIQRLPVSDDDTQAQTTDYISDQPMTTDLAALTPYQVTFRGFSDQVTAVLAGFAISPHGFIIKNISVQTANVTTDQTQSAPPPPMPGHAQIVLDEQMLRVTMMIEVVKLSPRS